MTGAFLVYCWTNYNGAGEELPFNFFGRMDETFNWFVLKEVFWLVLFSMIAKAALHLSLDENN